jgi:hypothetical protein
MAGMGGGGGVRNALKILVGKHLTKHSLKKVRDGSGRTILKLIFRGSSVSIVTRLRTGRPGFNSRQGLGSEAHPVSYSMDAGALFPGLKRQELEADHFPPSTAAFKNSWNYIFTPPYVFIAWYTAKHTDNFTFLLSLAPQPTLDLGLLHKIRLNFLEVSQQFFFIGLGY